MEPIFCLSWRCQVIEHGKIDRVVSASCCLPIVKCGSFISTDSGRKPVSWLTRGSRRRIIHTVRSVGVLTGRTGCCCVIAVIWGKGICTVWFVGGVAQIICETVFRMSRFKTIIYLFPQIEQDLLFSTTPTIWLVNFSGTTASAWHHLWVAYPVGSWYCPLCTTVHNQG